MAQSPIGVRKIKRYLEEHGIKTVTGKTEWSTSTIDQMLSNEKYVGDVRMQKTFTADFLTGRREKNIGQLDVYQDFTYNLGFLRHDLQNAIWPFGIAQKLRVV